MANDYHEHWWGSAELQVSQLYVQLSDYSPRDDNFDICYSCQ